MKPNDIWTTFMTKVNMKHLPLLLLLSLPLRLVFAEEQLPKPFSIARYQAMMDRSPFAVATAVAAPAATPNFAKDLYIANAAHDAKDGDFVTLASTTDKNFKKYLSTNGPVDGYGIASIEWSDKVGATKVTITKDDQSATLSFNEALLRGPAGPGGQNPVQAQVMQPPPQQLPQQQLNANDRKPDIPTAGTAGVVPGAQPNAAKPMPVPTLPTPPPRTRGVIPRNPGQNAMAPAQPKS
jgi:hypothetical protein